MAVPAPAAAQTTTVPIAICVVDTVRCNRAMLAQQAITTDHVAKGRFILGLGSGEMENGTSCGFHLEKPFSRFEEAGQIVRLLWRPTADRFRWPLRRARARTPRHRALWGPLPADLVGPRAPLLSIAGRYAEGWWPVGDFQPAHQLAWSQLMKAYLDACV